MKQRFIYFLFIAALAAFTAGCNDDSPTAPETGQNLIISGNFSDWTYGDDKSLSFISGYFPNIDTVASCKISDGGSYDLTVPAQQPNIKMQSVRDFFGAGYKGVLIISDPEAKVGAGRLLIQTEGNNMWGFVGWMYRDPVFPNANSYEMIYYYFDRPVSIKGALDCISCGWQFSVYNINAKAGWNVFWLRRESSTHKFYYEDYKPIGGKYEYSVIEEVEGLINSGSMIPYNQTPYSED